MLSYFPKTAGFVASRGATIAEIADALGVTRRTLYNWLNQHPPLQQAVYAGQELRPLHRHVNQQLHTNTMIADREASLGAV
jgi:transposase-like protein